MQRDSAQELGAPWSTQKAKTTDVMNLFFLALFSSTSSTHWQYRMMQLEDKSVYRDMLVGHLYKEVAFLNFTSHIKNIKDNDATFDL